MEKYKKKSLKFMGFSRDMRKIELDNQRCASRLKRFSMIRPLDDESITEEKNENSKIPTTGETQSGSRVELLQKWKQEKLLKKQQESKLKKPAFKVGVTKTNPSPSIGNKPLFALDSSRLLKSSFQVSNSRIVGKKQDNFVASSIKTTVKVPNSQSTAKKLDFATDKLKTSAKDIKVPPSKSKIVVNSKPASKWTKNKESSIQSLSMKPKVDPSSKVVNKDQLCGNRKQPITSKPFESKKESQLQPLATRSKVIPTTRSVKSNIPSSGLPKLTASKTLNKASDQQIPVKNTVKSIPKFSKAIPSQQKGSISKTPSTSKSKEPSKSNNKVNTFECEISHIEPIEEQRKSFAPKGFLFHPPAGLDSSLFLDDGPSAIFLRIRNQFLRTSTPKQRPSNQKSSPEIRETESLQMEDTDCLNNENSQDFKGTDKESETGNKQDFETLLSSSFGSVTLNDVKPMNKKSPEVVLSENHEEMLLSSKIVHLTQSQATEIPLSGEIHPTISHDSPEIVKSEIRFTDNICFGVISSSTLADSVEIGKTLTKLSVTSPSRSNNPPILSDLVNNGNIEIDSTAPKSVEIEETETNSCDVSSTMTNNPLIEPDLLEKDKTEVIFTGASNADGTIVTDLSSGNDSVFFEGEVMPRKNVDKNHIILNGFSQKQENSFVKRTFNFRRSEKPGLLSISESVENTPKSALKKKLLDGDFTPRRSLRLSKLSGNFSSLDNLLDSPKPKGQGPKENFTPRRSSRLSKLPAEFNSAENLFDIRRPTWFGTPKGPKENFTPRRSSRLSKLPAEFNSAENLLDIRRPTWFGTPKDESVSKLHSKLTYDFDRLSSETEEGIYPCTTGFKKVSLLPISRPSITRYSIKGDLMSFSPDV